MMPIRPPVPAKSIWKDWNFIVLIVCIIGLGVVLYLFWHFKGLAENQLAMKPASPVATEKIENEVVEKPVEWQKDITQVEDYTDIDTPADDIYWYLLDYIKKLPQDYVNRNSRVYSFDGLTRNPQKYRGSLVKMAGWVGYYTPIRLPKDNHLGLEFIYRVYVKDSWAGNSKECYIYDLIEKPPSLKTEKNDGDIYSSPVKVEGIFYKTVQYENQNSYPREDERYFELKEWMKQTIEDVKKGVSYRDIGTKYISQKEHEVIIDKLEGLFSPDFSRDNVSEEAVREIFYSQMRQRQLPLLIGKGLRIIDEKNAKRELGEFGSTMIGLSIFAFIVCTFITIRHIMATRPKPPEGKIGNIRTIKRF